MVISLLVFPSRTNLKLLKISITPQIVKKVITNLNLSKASDPDCIPLVVLKNFEPELSLALLIHGGNQQLPSYLLKRKYPTMAKKMLSVTFLSNKIGFDLLKNR